MSFKNCDGWRDCGLAISTPSNDTAKHFDDVITQYVSWTESADGMENTVVKMLQSDPDFTMGQALSIGLDLMGTGRPVHLDKEFSDQINKFEQNLHNVSLTKREKMHCQSVLYFAKGEYVKASETWEGILQDHPNDILAIKFAHDSYFYLGNSLMIRDSVARVLPHWKSSDPLYGYLKGMLAFGQEEMNQYSEAEKSSEEALSLNPTDCWATHAKAHCFEMTGRFDQGIEFLGRTENDWSKGRMLACHNYWHWALYYIEKGDYESALGLYDQQVEARSVASGDVLDMVDAASQLKRFEMQGVNVGKRWGKVFDLCSPHIDDHLTVFNDFHMMMAFLACKESKENVVDKHMASLTQFCATQKKSFSRDLLEVLCIDLCHGLVAFNDDHFDEAVQYWHPIKDEVIKMGGSHAQRDVFNQLLINACIDASMPSNRELGRELITQRKIKKENSPLTDRMMQRLLSKHD